MQRPSESGSVPRRQRKEDVRDRAGTEEEAGGGKRTNEAEIAPRTGTIFGLVSTFNHHDHQIIVIVVVEYFVNLYLDHWIFQFLNVLIILDPD